MSEGPNSIFSQEEKTGPADQPVARTGLRSAPGPEERATNGGAGRRPWLLFFDRPTSIAALILACVVLFSLYVRVADYGFYEDDYWGIVPWFKTPAAEMWATTLSHLQTWPTGRPL
ncbi:MAG: hypothetical protein JO232_07705, partial [Verrucomicrobia bacterium]|nr:hypothetical protein [Verrucomicrobiota bacterium]